MSFNKCIIVGYLGRDPEVRYSSQGKAVCTFPVATSEKRKDSNGDTQDVTTWFRVTFFGRQAEVAQEYLAKGKQVYVEGRLRQTEYTDREGNKRTTLEVTGSELQFLGDRTDSAPKQAAAAAPAAAAPAAAAPTTRKPESAFTIEEDDIPF